MAGYNRKKLFLRELFIMIISTLCLPNINCREPPEYPDGYEQVPPPDPPEIISPLPDTAYNGDIVHVLFDWTTIDQAEAYELNIDTMATFSTSFTSLVQCPPITLKIDRYKAVTRYYYHIRAGSRRWLYYTDWSETRKFYVKPEG